MEGNRRWWGIDALLVTGPIAEALQVPQAAGLLVKQVVKDSIASQIGLRGGGRVGILEGQRLVVGGDIVLSVQGIPVTSKEDLLKAVTSLEKLRPGDALRLTVLREGKVEDLSMTFTDR